MGSVLNKTNIPRSLPDLFFRRVKQTPQKEALKAKKGGQWYTVTWQIYEDNVFAIASGISDWVGDGERVCILSENRPEWVMTDMAILCLGAVSVPIFPSCPLDDIASIVEDCQAGTIFVSNPEQLQKIVALFEEGRVPSLKRVIMFSGIPNQESEDVFWSFQAVLARGEGIERDEIRHRLTAIKKEQLATLIYTSGTTGVPKGVMLSHENILHNLLGLRDLAEDIGIRNAQMLSLLSLSHAFERTIGHFMPMMMGFRVAYSGGIADFLKDMHDIRPELIVGVPLLYEEIHDRVLKKARESRLNKALLGWCLQVGKKKARYASSGQTPGFFFQSGYQVAERILFQKLHDLLGGRLRLAVSGGAPLRPEIAKFFLGAGITILEGYGLTETSPVLTSNLPKKMRIGSVGRPLKNVELKIAPEPDRKRDGEILARGPNVMLGYYGKDHETKEMLQDDGWLRTGDIGYIDGDGFLFITDRKKELLKTTNGKYIAPQPIENRLNAHPLIERAVVIGDKRRYCVALIIPDFDELRETIETMHPENGFYLKDREVLFRQKEVRLMYQEIVDEVNQNLGGWEQVRNFALLSSSLSHESGELTHTLKVKRHVIEKKFAKVIEALY